MGRNKVVTYSYGEGINPLTEVECRWVDLTMDGAIDIADQAAYASCHNLMFSSPECIRADFNGDGIVGSQDWAIFGSFKGFPGDLLNDFDYCADETIPLRDIPFSEEEDQLCVGGECVPIP